MEPVGPFESIRRLGVIAWSLAGLALMAWVVIVAVTKVAIIFPPLVLAVAIIYLLNPLVGRLDKFGIHRLFGSCISYLGLVLVFTIAGFFIVPAVADQGQALIDRFPIILTDLGDQVTDLGDRLGVDVSLPELPTEETIADWLEDPDNQQLVRDQVGTIFDATLTVLEFILTLVLAPFLAFYLLMDLPGLGAKVRQLLPADNREELVHVGRQLSTAIGGFVRGQLVVALIVGVMSSVGFRIIGLPFWLIIGLIAGLLNIVPFVGPWVGGALGVVAGLTSGEPSKALLAAVVAVVVQQIDNHFISPLVLRATVRLHPAAIMLALIAGGSLGGLFGVLIAVPIIASVKIVVGHYWRTRVLGQSWDQVDRAHIEHHSTGELQVPAPAVIERTESTPDGPEAPVPYLTFVSLLWAHEICETTLTFVSHLP